MSFLELAAARYSVRSYHPRPVEEEKVRSLLHAAQLAPTARNLQPISIYVLASEQALQSARQCSPLTYGAPLILLFCYQKGKTFHTNINSVNFGLVDASIVATHVMMQATDLGLGTVCVGYFDEEKVKASFALPEDEQPVLMMPVGYALNAEPSPRHAETKSVDELCVWL